MLSRKYQTAKQKLCAGLAAPQPCCHACSPIGWHSWRAELWLASRRPPELGLAGEWPPQLWLASRGRCRSLGRAGPCLGRPRASPASSSPWPCGNPQQKSSPPSESKGLGFMETVRLIQNMCKMIFTSKVERHPFGAGSFWLGPSTRSWGSPWCSGGSCRSLCRDWKKEGAGSPPLLLLLTLPSWTRAGVISAPEKLSYTTQLCDSSQQKWMKNAVPVTPGHENSEALLKQTH